MKKILILFLSACSLGMQAQTSKATIKNYFLTGLKPTQSQFATLIDNSYNETTANGILQGYSYPTIAFAPYTSRQSFLSFYTGTSDPTGTTQLNVNGYLHATKFFDGLGNELFSASPRTAGDLTTGFINYSGTTAVAGQFNGGVTNPTATNVLNYEGYFKSTRGYFNQINLQGVVMDSNYIKFKGTDNVMLGFESGYYTTTGTSNILLGIKAGYANTIGGYNNFLGNRAGYTNSTGNYNNFLGYRAGYYNTIGNSNNFIGNQSGNLTTTGNSNNFIGNLAGYSNKAGSYNNFIGYKVGYSNIDGSNNIYIGVNIEKKKWNSSNILLIDNNNDSISTFIAGDMAADTLRINATTTIGKSVNNFKVESDGNVKLSGTGTYWDDDNLDPTTLTGTGNLPTAITFASTTISIAGYSATQLDNVEGKRELPHRWKLGSPITFHAHCYPTTTNTGVIRLGLEYFFTQEGVATTTSTTIYVEVAASGTAWAKQTIDFAAITPPSELGTQFHFRFFRDGANANDTYTGVIGISTIGYHFESDELGSNLITTK